MTSVGKSERRLRGGFGIEVLGNFASLLHLLGAFGEIEKRGAAIGPDHGEASAAIFNVGFGGFQRGRRNRFSLREHRLDGLDQGMAHGHGGA